MKDRFFTWFRWLPKGPIKSSSMKRARSSWSPLYIGCSFWFSVTLMAFVTILLLFSIIPSLTSLLHVSRNMTTLEIIGIAEWYMLKLLRSSMPSTTWTLPVLSSSTLASRKVLTVWAIALIMLIAAPRITYRTKRTSLTVSFWPLMTARIRFALKLNRCTSLKRRSFIITAKVCRVKTVQPSTPLNRQSLSTPSPSVKKILINPRPRSLKTGIITTCITKVVLPPLRTPFSLTLTSAFLS